MLCRPRLALASIGILLVLILIGGFVLLWRPARETRTKIDLRYQQLLQALSISDTNAVVALVAPQYRATFDGGDFSRLKDFARPLGSGSAITVHHDEATICPIRLWHYGVIPGGHTISLVRVGEEWFFTGRVHID